MKEEPEVSRRRLFQLGGGALTLSAFSATGSLGFMPTAQAAVADVPLQVLSKVEARQLLAVARTMFPHDFLDDRYYAAVVTAVDAKATTDAATVGIVRDGLAKVGAEFAILQEDERERLLAGMEGSPFFKLVYGETVNGLYGNHEVWTILGYEGSSVEQGGYIGRGFDDIDWLPEA